MNIGARQWNSLINSVIELEEELERLHYMDTAYQTCKTHLDQARERLRYAMDQAEWGPNGCVFMTRTAEVFAGSDKRKDLYINRRRRATLWSNGRVTVYTAKEAQEEYEAIKVEHQQMDEDYQRNLAILGRLLWENNVTEMDLDTNWNNPNDAREIVKGWTYWAGQDGGYFCSDDTSVSASGALNRAQVIEAEEGPCISGPEWQECILTIEADRKYYGARH